jgi:hypothetical protein
MATALTMNEGGFLVRFAIVSLATWRLTHLLAHEDGPGDVLARLRAAVGAGFWGRLMDCFYCLSLWISAPLTLLLTSRLVEGAMIWLALSGSACLLERATASAVQFSPLPAVEERREGFEKKEIEEEVCLAVDRSATR